MYTISFSERTLAFVGGALALKYLDYTTAPKARRYPPLLRPTRSPFLPFLDLHVLHSRLCIFFTFPFLSSKAKAKAAFMLFTKELVLGAFFFLLLVRLLPSALCHGSQSAPQTSLFIEHAQNAVRSIFSLSKKIESPSDQHHHIIRYYQSKTFKKKDAESNPTNRECPSGSLLASPAAQRATL